MGDILYKEGLDMEFHANEGKSVNIEVNGKTYAASQNGMPHAVYSITDNNFNGHFCIHFLNSRTHTGNRLDSAHQSCVKAAYSAGN